MRGRKPRPVEQRRLEAEDVSHRPLPEPLMVSGRPDLAEMSEPPEGLGKAGEEFWRDTVVQLVDVGMIDLVDDAALAILARTWDEYAKADAVVRSEGFFTHGSSGQIKEHPALKIRARARLEFMRYAEQFGLTPMARTRFGLAELHRRSLGAELEKALDKPEDPTEGVIEGTAVEDDDDVGLPGL